MSIKELFGVERDFLENVLVKNASAMGYLHGALSEELLKIQLVDKGFDVYRIKEKPAGSFDSKNEHYRGDFLIKKPEDEEWLVIESKGLKTNAEFRGDNKEGEKNRKTIINMIWRLINTKKEDVYKRGHQRYQSAKEKWEKENVGKLFPEFGWTKDYPGPNSVDLGNCFKTKKEVEEYFNSIYSKKFEEEAFRNKTAAYYILETHKPNSRKDEVTGIEQSAPLKSDFSILAVDLFQRYKEHFFVFADAKQLSHSPTSPNHLYQNYLIDIIIPGKKDCLNIKKPWYTSIEELLSNSTPARVKFDESQIDYRK